jgi:hypothetical protein
MNHNDVVDGDKERSDLFVITEAIMRVFFSGAQKRDGAR